MLAPVDAYRVLSTARLSKAHLPWDLHPFQVLQVDDVDRLQITYKLLLLIRIQELCAGSLESSTLGENL